VECGMGMAIRGPMDPLYRPNPCEGRGLACLSETQTFNSRQGFGLTVVTNFVDGGYDQNNEPNHRRD